MLTPLRVKAYLQQHGASSVALIAKHFQVDCVCVEFVIKVWLKQGKVKRQQACSSCKVSCQSTMTYHWVES